MYKFTIEVAIVMSINLRSEGGLATFPFSMQYFVIGLMYRDDCDGNPCLAFDVLYARQERHVDVLSAGGNSWSHILLLQKQDDEQRRADPRWHAGVLLVLVFVPDF